MNLTELYQDHLERKDWSLTVDDVHCIFYTNGENLYYKIKRGIAHAGKEILKGANVFGIHRSKEEIIQKLGEV